MRTTSNTTHSAYTLAKLVAAASTIMFFECQGQMADITNKNPNGVDGSSPGGNGITSAGNNGPQYVTGRFVGAPSGGALFSTNPVHTDGANYIFTDGHVKYMRASTVSAGWGNQGSPANCGAFPGDYTSGTTTVDGQSVTGGQAASADAMGQSCGGVTPLVTFSPT